MITIEKLINSEEEMTIEYVYDGLVVYTGIINGYELEVKIIDHSDTSYQNTETCSTLLRHEKLYEVDYKGSIEIRYEDLKTMKFLVSRIYLDGKCKFNGYHYGLFAKLSGTLKFSGKLKYMDKRLTNDDYYSYDELKELLSDVNIEIEDSSSYRAV